MRVIFRIVWKLEPIADAMHGLHPSLRFRISHRGARAGSQIARLTRGEAVLKLRHRIRRRPLVVFDPLVFVFNFVRRAMEILGVRRYHRESTEQEARQGFHPFVELS